LSRSIECSFLLLLQQCAHARELSIAELFSLDHIENQGLGGIAEEPIQQVSYGIRACFLPTHRRVVDEGATHPGRCVTKVSLALQDLHRREHRVICRCCCRCEVFHHLGHGGLPLPPNHFHQTEFGFSQVDRWAACHRFHT